MTKDQATIPPRFFLHELWSRAISGSFAEFRAYQKDRGGSSIWLPLPVHQTDLEAALQWALQQNVAGYHLAHGVQPRFWRPANNRAGCNADVMHYLALVMDFDEFPAGAEAEQRLKQAGIPSSAVVFTGRGRHLYLLLDGPVPAIQAQPVAQRMCRWLGSDGVHDPARILRTPGTINVKPEAAGAICEVLSLTGQRYQLNQITEVLDRAGAPTITPTKTVSSTRIRRVTAPAPIPADRLARLLGAVAARIRDLIERGHHAGDRFPSRSEADLAVADALVRAGALDEEIVWIFQEYAIGEKARETGPGYLQTTLNRARRSALSVDAIEVEVLDAREQGNRVVLRLAVREGPRQGLVFAQGLTVGSSGARYACEAGGVHEPRQLVGKRPRAALRETAWGLEVMRWVGPGL